MSELSNVGQKGLPKEDLEKLDIIEDQMRQGRKPDAYLRGTLIAKQFSASPEESRRIDAILKASKEAK